MVEQHYITKEGYEKLKNELDELKTKRRKEVAERLRVAAAQGDLSENFEYATAREEQAFVEGRIHELEDILKSVTIVSEDQKQTGKVQVGSVVTVGFDGEEIVYTITGAQESDPLQGKISSDSPIGQALLGKKPGDTAKVETPGGVVSYTIKEIV